MKNFYVFTLVVCLLPVMGYSQVQQGAFTLGGSFSLSSQDNKQEFPGSNNIDSETKRNSFWLNPRVGYFATSTLVVGVGFNYRNDRFKRTDLGTNNNTIETVTNEFAINPYIEKYFPIVEQLYVTTSFNVLIGTGKVKEEQPESFESDITSFSINLIPGLTYFVSDKFAISANFGQLFYNSRKVKNEPTTNRVESENTTNVFGLNASLDSFALGIRYFIGNNSE